MNANTARSLSQVNSFRLAEVQLKEAIAELERQIIVSCSKGLFEARPEVSIASNLIKNGYAGDIGAYFDGLGYRVSVVEGSSVYTVSVSWYQE